VQSVGFFREDSVVVLVLSSPRTQPNNGRKMNQWTALCLRRHYSPMTVLITYTIAFNMFYWRTYIVTF